MESDFEVLKSLKRSAPPELDLMVKSRIKKHKVKIYSLMILLFFLVSFSTGALLAMFFTAAEKNTLLSSIVKVEENPHNKVYPGVAPIRLTLVPKGSYVYRVYVNGDAYKEGVTEREIKDSVFLQDPVNNVEVEIEDPVNGDSHYVSWVIFNF